MLASVRMFLVALALTTFTAVSHAQSAIGLVFDGCGTMVDGIECTLFQPDSGGFYLLISPVPVQLGDRLHVVGVVDPDCNTICQQGPCLAATLVEDCGSFDVICRADGSDPNGCSDCPCGNNAPLDSRGGCLNSTAQSAELQASGIPTPFGDSLHFDVVGANPGTFGILISGAQLLPANPANPCPAGSGITSSALDGFRCVGQALRRHGTRATDANGDIGLTNAGWGGNDPPTGGLIAQGGFEIGQTRHWQVFYREASNLVCMRGQNSTNAISTLIHPLTPGTF